MAERLAPVYPPFEKIVRHAALGIAVATILVYQAHIMNDLGLMTESLRQMGKIATYGAVLYAFLPYIEFGGLVALEKIRAFEERRGWVE